MTQFKIKHLHINLYLTHSPRYFSCGRSWN